MPLCSCISRISTPMGRGNWSTAVPTVGRTPVLKMCRYTPLPSWVVDLKAQRLRQDFEAIGLDPSLAAAVQIGNSYLTLMLQTCYRTKPLNSRQRTPSGPALGRELGRNGARCLMIVILLTDLIIPTTIKSKMLCIPNCVIDESCNNHGPTFWCS